MPFTVSHIAAVLPFVSRKRYGLPLAALAAGSMAPDFLYFVPPLINYGRYLHGPKYAFTVGLVAAIAAWVVWRALAPGIYSIAPEFIRRRWDISGWRSYAIWQMVIACGVGIATHLFLDGFTHSWGFGTHHLSQISGHYHTPFGDLAGYEIAQNALSLLGLMVLLVVVVLLKPREVELSPTPKLQWAALWAVPSTAVVFAVLRTAAVGGFDSRYEALAFYLLTGAVAGAGIAVLLLGVSAQFASSRTRAAAHKYLDSDR